MTVAELIEKLRALDPEMAAVVDFDGIPHEVTDVQVEHGEVEGAERDYAWIVC